MPRSKRFTAAKADKKSVRVQMSDETGGRSRRSSRQQDGEQHSGGQMGKRRMSRLQSLIEGEQLLKEAGEEEEEKTPDQVGSQNVSNQLIVKSLDQAPGLAGEQLAQKLDAVATTSAQGAASEGSGTSVQISVEGVK